MPNCFLVVCTWVSLISSVCASALTRELEYSDWYLLKLSPEEGNITAIKENLESPITMLA